MHSHHNAEVYAESILGLAYVPFFLRCIGFDQDAS